MLSGQLFIPHGHCYLWKTELVALHLASDGLITVAYYSIPLLLLIFLHQRQDIPFSGILQLFSGFIIACGTTHLMEIWTLWHPTYWLSGGIKLTTAVISLSTVVALIRVLPQALSYPSPKQLKKNNQRLLAEIKQRQKTEAQLLEREQLFRYAFENAPIGKALVSPDGKFFRVNQSLCKIVGYAEAELLTKTFQDITHPDDVEADINYIHQVLAGTIQTYQIEKRYFHRLGHEVWILLNVSLVRHSDGKPLYFIDQIQDITQQKETKDLLLNYNQTLEAEVAKRTKALQISEASYRRLIETAHEGIWIIDTDGNTKFVNPRVTKLLGYSRKEMMGKPLLSFMGDEAKAIVDINKNPGNRFNEQNDLKLYRKDGSVLWVIISTTKIVDLEGNFTGSLMMLTDISDLYEELRLRKQAEKELQQALEAAKYANQAKSRFLANMSHELRTPLNAILGFTQILSRDSSCTSSQQEKLDIISQSGQHLLGLINDILSISKIEAGITKVNDDYFDLYYLLDSLESMFKIKAQTKGIELYVECTPEVPQYVKMDQSKLRQVLINILGNGIKFTQEGMVKLDVALSQPPDEFIKASTSGYSSEGKASRDIQAQYLEAGKTEGGMTNYPTKITFKISDTGSGIAPDELDTLFEAFVQTETGYKADTGTGLGLTISKHFVELMGGKITVESELRQGTTFTFEVEAISTNASNIERKPSLKRVVGLAPGQPTYRILVVEDRWENRYLLMQLLEPIGFQLKEACNGQEAIPLWRDWHPHLILMDMRMPVMDGYEATQQIKASLKGQATTIIAITASAFEEERSIILEAGCDDFIHKPFQESILFDKIAQYLGVKYIYEDVQEATTLPVQSFKKITQEDLLVMSSQWLSQLHRAALEGDCSEMLALIEQIPDSHNDLKLNLVTLVNNFQQETIINLTENNATSI